VKKLLVPVLILVFAVIGCSKDKAVSAAGGDGMKDPHVVAMVGNEKIMDADIDAFLSQMPEQARARYESPEGKREFVSSLAEIKLMALEAKKRGVDKDPDMKRKLDFITEQLLARGLAESAVKEIKINDADITKYYNDNKVKFNVGPRIKLRHILVSTEPEANAILAQLKKGADFSTLAKEKSKCPSAPKGGDLGWATKGMMVPEFENAAFALKKGEMSGVVKTQFGYHIIICDDIQAGKQMDMAEAKPAIERQLKGEKSEEAIKALIDQVKKNSPITINEEYFKKAQEEAAKSQPMPEPGLSPTALPSQPPAGNEAK
jgi:peptidyl-prolyl cis-trans isomerase C